MTVSENRSGAYLKSVSAGSSHSQAGIT